MCAYALTALLESNSWQMLHPMQPIQRDGGVYLCLHLTATLKAICRHTIVLM